MNDDSDNPHAEEMRRLKALAPLFIKGWAKRYPMPERDRALIDQAFGQSQPQVTQPSQPTTTKTRTQGNAATPTQPEQSPTQSKGPSHSH